FRSYSCDKDATVILQPIGQPVRDVADRETVALPDFACVCADTSLGDHLTATKAFQIVIPSVDLLLKSRSKVLCLAKVDMPLVRRRFRPALDDVGLGQTFPCLALHSLRHSVLVDVPDKNTTYVALENDTDIAVGKLRSHQIQLGLSPRDIEFEP